jgi:glycosyltransferase involved in cell wall biosynthesis
MPNSYEEEWDLERETLANEAGRSPAGGMPIRVLYALGPGDVVQFYRDSIPGKTPGLFPTEKELSAGTPAFQMSMPFSKQFLDWCDEAGLEVHGVSSSLRADHLQVGAHSLENRPKPPIAGGRGWLPILAQVWYGLRVVAWAVAERPDVVIVDSGTTEWIALTPLRLFGIPVIAVLHNTLWPMGYPQRRWKGRLLLRASGFFFRYVAAATVGVSPECARQVWQVAGRPRGPVLECRAQFRTGFLSRVAPVTSVGRTPFQVLFLGRFENIKGIYLIVLLARQLEAEHPGAFRWRMVGSGSEFEALKQSIAKAGVGHVVQVEASLPSEEVALRTMGWAHAMIVPTLNDFCEGLAMTAAECVLAGRPVVVSEVVPAWEVLDGAALKAEAGNVASFADALKRLALEPGCYEACQRATTAVQGQFYDRSQGLGAVLGRAVLAVTKQGRSRIDSTQ